MMKCSSCGTAQPPEASFCYSCGTPLTPPGCPACGTPLVEGARFCSACGAQQATADTDSPLATRPVSSRRVTSVLFGDLVGFTALAESRDQEETRELLTRYFEECRRVIGRYGGTVEKFIGDAVMAVWGVPTTHEDDAERAVRAGLELVVGLSAMGQDIGVPGLTMRVGIVTGEVAVTVGAEHEGMVAGDAVNTASRVQSVAAPGQVWVDETTRLLTSSAITYLDVGSHELKGKAEPVPLWSVHAVVASVGGVRRADGLEAPLVGRDRELRLLKEHFHGVEENRRPGLLLMVGDPGLGKTRLGWEFEKYIDGLNTTIRWHSGRCVAYGEGLAFFALAEAIRPRLRGLLPDDESQDATSLDPARLLELGLATYVDDEQEAEWLRPRLGALLGIGTTATFPQVDLFSAWTVFLERVGDGLPVVLLIDDAQHADDGLLLFVEHLLNVACFPCFIVLLSRPGLLENHPALATNNRATVSHLAPLSDADVGTLLSGLVVGLPESTRESLVRRSDGVPLFAVETVRSLIDRDLVVPRGGQYVLADPGALDVDSIDAPASLQALIAARLDTLEPEQRRLVERGSVIGNAFTREEIADLCADLGDLDALLAGLVHQQILGQLTSRFSAEYGQYQFVQSVVRQVAYSGLSRRDRRAMHLAVASQTEARADAAGDLAPIIAQHYLNAISAMPTEPDVSDLRTRAREQLERAAARARALGAMSDSAKHLVAALELTDDAEVSAKLESLIAWALVDSGDYQRAIPHATAAARAFDEVGDGVRAGLAAAAHGVALSLSGDNAAALTVVQPRWDALVDQADAEPALLPLARVITTSSVGDRRDVLDRRILMAERAGDREQLADALNALGIMYSNTGADETASIVLTAAAEIARSSDNVVPLATAATLLTTLQIPNDLAAAIEMGREAVETAERAGVAYGRGLARLNLLLARLAAGQWDDIHAASDAAGALDGQWPVPEQFRAIASGIRSFIDATRGAVLPPPGELNVPDSDSLSTIAWSAFANAQHALAVGHLEVALGHAMRATESMYAYSGVADDYVHMWPVAADLAHRIGDEASLTSLLTVLDRAAGRQMLPRGLRAHRCRIAGLLAQDADEPDEVESRMRSAIEGFTTWGSAHYRARSQAELGLWLRDRGRVEEASALLASARQTLSDMHAQTWLYELELVESSSGRRAQTSSRPS